MFRDIIVNILLLWSFVIALLLFYFVFIVVYFCLFRYFCRYISENCEMMNKDYESPLIEILEVDVEKGYLGSIPSYDEEDFNWN
jgi:hypothetical protein